MCDCSEENEVTERRNKQSEEYLGDQPTKLAGDVNKAIAHNASIRFFFHQLSRTTGHSATLSVQLTTPNAHTPSAVTVKTFCIPATILAWPVRSSAREVFHDFILGD